MYNSILYKKFSLNYCKQGNQWKNELLFFKRAKILRKQFVYLFNLIFETYALVFLKVYLKKKRIAKYAEIIPKLLTKKQRISQTFRFLKKYWVIFSFERYILQKEKNNLYRLIYKNRLNYNRWK